MNPTWLCVIHLAAGIDEFLAVARLCIEPPSIAVGATISLLTWKLTNVLRARAANTPKSGAPSCGLTAELINEINVNLHLHFMGDDWKNLWVEGHVFDPLPVGEHSIFLSPLLSFKGSP